MSWVFFHLSRLALEFGRAIRGNPPSTAKNSDFIVRDFCGCYSLSVQSFSPSLMLIARISSFEEKPGEMWTPRAGTKRYPFMSDTVQFWEFPAAFSRRQRVHELLSETYIYNRVWKTLSPASVHCVRLYISRESDN